MFVRIKKRYEAALGVLPQIKLRPAAAMREALAAGYGRGDLRADVLAGLVVGVVALPLSMALAIAVGVAPQYGLYTAIIAGALIACLGGSRTQVSGPTAAFVVILAPIATKFGVSGLLLASMMAGAILIALGAARLGRLITFVPYPVTAGFTAGIAVVIATLQLKDLLGLQVATMPEHYLERVHALAVATPSASWPSVAIGVFTFAMLILFPRVTKRVPAPLVALVAAALVAWLAARFVPGFSVDTVGTRFSYVADGATHPGIPRMPPMPIIPWAIPGPDGRPFDLSLATLRALAPSAFAIAMLGAIESLLSAVVADGMARTKHDPDAELVAQGIGNVVAPLFGGFAATGAIARTATNIRAGARSPIAAVVHAVFILAAVLALAPLVAYLPMPALAALLLLVAWNMSEAKHFVHVLRVAPKSDVVVLLSCFALTIVFDMVVSVTAGVLLAALLFMRRMAEFTGSQLTEGQVSDLAAPLPKGVVLYRIAGPLFFGAAQKAMSSLETVSGQIRVVVLDMSAVPVMDATGLVNLESALERLTHARTLVVLAGVVGQPAKLLEKAGIARRPDQLEVATTLAEALGYARNHLSERAHPSPAIAVPAPG